MINMFNPSQFNKEKNTENSNQNNLQIQGETQAELIIPTGNNLLQGCSQYTDLGVLTQEKVDIYSHETNNFINYINPSGSCSTVDEIPNQNYMSLATLKGKMSQEITLEPEKKKFKKNYLGLNWQEGKVTMKKGKEKITCNYAFTPTKSSLRVKCIYCGKIYSSVKSFISHRTRCINNKPTQGITSENFQTSINSQNIVSSSKNINEKLNNCSNQQSIYFGNNIEQTENTQASSQINFSGIQNSKDEYKFLINQNNLKTREQKVSEYERIHSIENSVQKFKNFFQSDSKIQNANFFNDTTEKNFKKNNEVLKNYIETNINSNKTNFENFKIYLYAAMSCLPKTILEKIIKKRTPELLSKLEYEQISKEKMVELIFLGITSKQKKTNLENSKNESFENKISYSNSYNFFENHDGVDSNHSNDLDKTENDHHSIENNIKKSEFEQINGNQNEKTNQNFQKNDEFELEIFENEPKNSTVENVKSENALNVENKTNDEDIFEFNIPVFFRHSKPKFQDWKCHVCKINRDKKNTMMMCENCGYFYHSLCQDQNNKYKINDWFCDNCKNNIFNLRAGSKFQIGELVWVNHKNLIWPAQIIGFSEELFEIIIFHTEEKICKESEELISWSEGISSIDGFASKGAFTRESFKSVMHWQSIYKGLKYYMKSLRCKSRRLPQNNNKQQKSNLNLNKKKNNLNKNSFEKKTINNINHPLPLEISNECEIQNDEIKNNYLDDQLQIKSKKIDNYNCLKNKINSEQFIEDEIIINNLPSTQINCSYTQYSY